MKVKDIIFFEDLDDNSFVVNDTSRKLEVKVSKNPDNLLEQRGNGLYVPSNAGGAGFLNIDRTTMLLNPTFSGRNAAAKGIEFFLVGEDHIEVVFHKSYGEVSVNILDRDLGIYQSPPANIEEGTSNPSFKLALSPYDDDIGQAGYRFTATNEDVVTILHLQYSKTMNIGEYKLYLDVSTTNKIKDETPPGGDITVGDLSIVTYVKPSLGPGAGYFIANGAAEGVNGELVPMVYGLGETADMQPDFSNVLFSGECLLDNVSANSLDIDLAGGSSAYKFGDNLAVYHAASGKFFADFLGMNGGFKAAFQPVITYNNLNTVAGIIDPTTRALMVREISSTGDILDMKMYSPVLPQEGDVILTSALAADLYTVLFKRGLEVYALQYDIVTSVTHEPLLVHTFEVEPALAMVRLHSLLSNVLLIQWVLGDVPNPLWQTLQLDLMGSGIWTVGTPRDLGQLSFLIFAYPFFTLDVNTFTFNGLLVNQAGPSFSVLKHNLMTADISAESMNIPTEYMNVLMNGVVANPFLMLGQLAFQSSKKGDQLIKMDLGAGSSGDTMFQSAAMIENASGQFTLMAGVPSRKMGLYPVGFDGQVIKAANLLEGSGLIVDSQGIKRSVDTKTASIIYSHYNTGEVFLVANAGATNQIAKQIALFPDSSIKHSSKDNVLRVGAWNNLENVLNVVEINLTTTEETSRQYPFNIPAVTDGLNVHSNFVMLEDYAVFAVQDYLVTQDNQSKMFIFVLDLITGEFKQNELPETPFIDAISELIAVNNNRFLLTEVNNVDAYARDRMRMAYMQIFADMTVATIDTIYHPALESTTSNDDYPNIVLGNTNHLIARTKYGREFFDIVVDSTLNKVSLRTTPLTPEIKAAAGTLLDGIYPMMAHFNMADTSDGNIVSGVYIQHDFPADNLNRVELTWQDLAPIVPEVTLAKRLVAVLGSDKALVTDESKSLFTTTYNTDKPITVVEGTSPFGVTTDLNKHLVYDRVRGVVAWIEAGIVNILTSDGVKHTHDIGLTSDELSRTELGLLQHESNNLISVVTWGDGDYGKYSVFAVDFNYDPVVPQLTTHAARLNLIGNLDGVSGHAITRRYLITAHTTGVLLSDVSISTSHERPLVYGEILVNIFTINDDHFGTLSHGQNAFGHHVYWVRYYNVDSQGATNPVNVFELEGSAFYLGAGNGPQSAVTKITNGQYAIHWSTVDSLDLACIGLSKILIGGSTANEYSIRVSSDDITKDNISTMMLSYVNNSLVYQPDPTTKNPPKVTSAL